MRPQKINPNKVMPSHCKSCVLRPDISKRIPLADGRLAEIEMNALNGINQICHHGKDNTLCRGVRNFQLDIFHKLGIIKEPTDACLLQTMKKVLASKKDCLHLQTMEPESKFEQLGYFKDIYIGDKFMGYIVCDKDREEMGYMGRKTETATEDFKTSKTTIRKGTEYVSELQRLCGRMKNKAA